MKTITKTELQELEPLDESEIAERNDVINDLYADLNLYPGEHSSIMREIREHQADLKLNQEIIAAYQ